MWFKITSTSKGYELKKEYIEIIKKHFIIKKEFYQSNLYSHDEWYIHLENMDDLLHLRDLLDNELILTNNGTEIEIYDDWRE